MIGAVVRFVVSALVLLLVSFIVPGFRIAGFWPALLAAVAIAALGYLAEALFGRRVSPATRGLSGFIAATIVLFLTQYIVPGVSMTWVGAAIAALVIGLVDAVVPTELR